MLHCKLSYISQKTLINKKIPSPIFHWAYDERTLCLLGGHEQSSRRRGKRQPGHSRLNLLPVFDAASCNILPAFKST